MDCITDADAERFSAIRVALGEIHAYADPALLWHAGERHDDDQDDDPQLLADERPAWLLNLPRQID